MITAPDSPTSRMAAVLADDTCATCTYYELATLVDVPLAALMVYVDEHGDEHASKRSRIPGPFTGADDDTTLRLELRALEVEAIQALADARDEFDALPEAVDIYIRSITHEIPLHGLIAEAGEKRLTDRLGTPASVVRAAVAADLSIQAVLSRIGRMLLQVELVDAGVGDLDAPMFEALRNSPLPEAGLGEVVKRVRALHRVQDMAKSRKNIL